MTLTPEIARALGPGPLANPEHLVAVHVSSEQLGVATGDERPEAQLYRSLLDTTETTPARVAIHGDGGSGKTSLILRASSEAAKAPGALDVLILRCGEDPARLASTASFIDYMIGTLQSQTSFSSIDQERLARATGTVDATPPTATHSAAVGGGAVPAVYRFDWKEAVESFSFERSGEERRQILIDQIGKAARHGRLVVVVDDTDRFAAEGPDGKIDEDSISNLFQHGIDFLLALPVAVLVAVHPAYRDVPAVQRITQRGGFEHLEVPLLPADAVPPPLTKVLDRRLTVGGFDGIRAEDLFEPAALAQLQGPYFEGARHDLRQALRLVELSVSKAITRGASTVHYIDVQAALEELPS